MAKSVHQEEEIWRRIDALTVEQYADALRALDGEGKISPNQGKMLRIHCEAPDQTLTARQLARKAGLKGIAAVNLQYGGLAHAL